MDPAAARRQEKHLLDEQPCFALHSASLAIARAHRPLPEALGPADSQYLAMRALRERDGRSVSEPGDCPYLDSGTLTPLLERLALLRDTPLATAPG